VNEGANRWRLAAWLVNTMISWDIDLGLIQARTCGVPHCHGKKERAAGDALAACELYPTIRAVEDRGVIGDESLNPCQRQTLCTW
jgi:hypothetical protein